MGSKQRLDLLLVERGLADTRSQAQALIMAGAVYSMASKRLDKAGTEVVTEHRYFGVPGRPVYVSRAGQKLESGGRGL